MRKENCKGEEQNELPRDPLGGHSSLSSPLHSSPTQLHCVKTTPGTTGTADLLQQEFEKTDFSVQAPKSSNSDTVATVVHQIMTKLSEAVSKEDRIMVITKMALMLMKQNGC
jgi:hypothetical protein